MRRTSDRKRIGFSGFKQKVNQRSYVCGVIVGFLVTSSSSSALADCSPSAASNIDAVCSGSQTSTYGTGSETNISITIASGASVSINSPGNLSGIKFMSGTLNNDGSISVASANGAAHGVTARSTWNLNNVGNISATGAGQTLGVYGTFSTGASSITNMGQISASSASDWAQGLSLVRNGEEANFILYNRGTISASTNSGQATAILLLADFYSGKSTIINTGAIIANSQSTLDAELAQHNVDGIWCWACNIDTIINMGSITSNGVGIDNPDGSIKTLVNYQGGNSSSPATTALTYDGTPPTNYWTYVTSKTHYGQLSFLLRYAPTVTGTLNFGIYPGSNIQSGKYLNVLTGLENTNISANSGKFGGYNWTLVPSGPTSYKSGPFESIGPGLNWDLVVTGLSTSNTLSQVASATTKVRTILDARRSVISASLSYDCPAFDRHGICLWFQARYTGTGNESDGAGVLTAATRINPKLRIGAFLDYGAPQIKLNGIHLGSALPLLGAFARYSDKPSGLGAQAKIAGAINSGNLTITRDSELLDTEPGAGKAKLNTLALEGEFGWGFNSRSAFIVTPYVGVRYTTASRGAYSEGVTPNVSFPLSYSQLSYRSTTAVTGLRLTGLITSRVGYQIDAGTEYDFIQKNSSIMGTSGINSLNTFEITNNSNPNSFRARGSAGLNYKIDNNRALTGTISARQQTYSKQTIASVLLGYRGAF